MLDKTEADICLLLEGTYPYIAGGVSTWTHELIKSQSDLTFTMVCILPPHGSTKRLYEVPKNVLSIQNLFLSQHTGLLNRRLQKAMKALFEKIEVPLLNLQTTPRLSELKKILDAFHRSTIKITSNELINSEPAWRMLTRMYSSQMGDSSFLNYFWSWRSLLGGLYTILLSKLPEAKVYHALCTGYAGLLLAKAHIEKNRPCLITEHGIYSNERKIEIASAKWLEEEKSLNLTLHESKFDKGLKEFWVDNFVGFSKLAYEAASLIITLTHQNINFQLTDGADPNKIRIIPNGVDVEKFGKIQSEKQKRPTVALIGRVVPIKDIKTFIRAVHLLRQKIPNLQAFVVGPKEEDPEYYSECLHLTERLNLKDTLTFTGKVNIVDILPKVDVIALTSISESQPLVLLEAGCAKIPAVATDVGACREILLGREDENPNLGPGGEVCPLSNPEAIASALLRLLTDKQFSIEAGENIKRRVEKFYNKKELDQTYKTIYHTLMEGTVWPALDLSCAN